MQRAGPSSLVLAHILAILAVLAALLTGCAMSWFVAAFACFDTCSTADYYFAHLAPGEALFMLPCVALAALAVAVFVPYCLDTHQPGRALFVFLFFLVGGLFGVAALYGLAQLALAILSNSDSPYVDQEAADWMRGWTVALMLVAVVWSGSLASLLWSTEWSPGIGTALEATGAALEAVKSARSALTTLVRTCSAACSQINWRALHANLHDGALARRMSHEVAALQVLPPVSASLQHSNRRPYEARSTARWRLHQPRRTRGSQAPHGRCCVHRR